MLERQPTAAPTATVPEVRDWSLETGGPPVNLRGSLLGFASSQRDDHTHDGDRPPSGWKCSACRWIEIWIIVDSEDGGYVVRTVGRSVVPGESPRFTLDRTASAFEVVEILTVREQHHVFLPRPSARALAQAARYDGDIRDAYENRAVV